MGEKWETVRRLLTDDLERERSAEILRAKIPQVKGLSAETAAAVASGELEIVTDDGENT